MWGEITHRVAHDFMSRKKEEVMPEGKQLTFPPKRAEGGTPNEKAE